MYSKTLCYHTGHRVGPSKNWTLQVTVTVRIKRGPMGTSGLGPNPFSIGSACSPGVFFVERASNNHKHTDFYENRCISSL